MSERDKRAILRRRAFFVGSALTALTGCPKQESPPDKPTVVGVQPATSSSVLPSGSGVATKSSASPAPKAPTLAIPADAKGFVREQYEQLAMVVPPTHRSLELAEAALDNVCDITDPKCDEAWKKVAENYAIAEDQMIGLSTPCPATSKEGKAFEVRQTAHRNHIEARKKALLARIDALLKGADAKAKWNTHKASAAVPQPCLDFACNDW